MKNHQNTSHTLYTYSKVNSIGSSYLQAIDVLFETPCKYQVPIPIMHFVLFDFVPLNKKCEKS
jgi:hypothetical protein